MDIVDKIKNAVESAEILRQYNSHFFALKTKVEGERDELDQNTRLLLEDKLSYDYGGNCEIIFLIGDNMYEITISNMVATITEIEVGHKTIRGAW